MTKSTKITILRDLSDVLHQVSSTTGLTQQQLETQFEDVQLTVYRFKNRILVLPEEFNSIIDRWAAALKAQIKCSPSIPPNSKRGAKTQTTRAIASLPLPENYRDRVSHLYGPSLKRIMPQNVAEQKTFLGAIANETTAGVELLNELSVLIAQKYTGKMASETAYHGLKNKAQVLLNELSGTTKPKAQKSTRTQKAKASRRKKTK